MLLDVDGHVCLADFGMSKETANNNVNMMHTACGTPVYTGRLAGVMQGTVQTKRTKRNEKKQKRVA